MVGPWAPASSIDGAGLLLTSEDWIEATGSKGIFNAAHVVGNLDIVRMPKIRTPQLLAQPREEIVAGVLSQ